MKITQKDKMMLVLLCVVMVCALIYMFGIKKFMEQKATLTTEVDEAKAAWEEKISPVNSAFISADSAELIWKKEGTQFLGLLNQLNTNNQYSLGRQITLKEAEAAKLADATLLPEQEEFDLFAFIKQQYFDGYIDFYHYDISTVTDTPYSPPAEEGEEPVEGEEAAEPEEYIIRTAKIVIDDMNCNNNFTPNIYAMLNKMETSGYIIVDSFEYNPSSATGSLAITILMTPGDLSDYAEEEPET